MNLFAQAPVSGNNSVFALAAILCALLILVGIVLGKFIISIAKEHLSRSNVETKTNYSLLPGGGPTGEKAGRPNVIKLKKGFGIKLLGKAKGNLDSNFTSATYAVKPTSFNCLQPIPKMLVKESDKVKAGDKLFYDRKIDNVFFTAPVSGEVAEIKRGAKRAITEVIIRPDKENSFKKFAQADPNDLRREKVVEQLVESGAWTLLNQRPFGVLADVDAIPKAIYISTFDTAPLAVDYDFVMNHADAEDWQAGIDALWMLSYGNVHLNMNAKRKPLPLYLTTQGVKHNWFEGAHPAGNVGVQIHHVDPINKGDVVWTVKPEDVLTIGKVFSKGIYEPKRFVSINGSVVTKPMYVDTYLGANVQNLLENNLIDEHVRIVSGNVLTGTAIEKDGHLGYFDNMISVLKEGDYHEAFGWLVPQKARPSLSPTIPFSRSSWLSYEADTNMHGEDRAFVMTGQYESVLPMDVYLQILLKKIIAQDFDAIEGLGIYELLEEDVALCEFVCTSKQPVQKILREGIEFIQSQS